MLLSKGHRSASLNLALRIIRNRMLRYYTAVSWKYYLDCYSVVLAPSQKNVLQYCAWSSQSVGYPVPENITSVSLRVCCEVRPFVLRYCMLIPNAAIFGKILKAVSCYHVFPLTLRLLGRILDQSLIKVEFAEGIHDHQWAFIRNC